MPWLGPAGGAAMEGVPCAEPERRGRRLGGAEGAMVGGDAMGELGQGLCRGTWKGGQDEQELGARAHGRGREQGGGKPMLVAAVMREKRWHEGEEKAGRVAGG